MTTRTPKRTRFPGITADARELGVNRVTSLQDAGGVSRLCRAEDAA
jgi:hypothetical protein